MSNASLELLVRDLVNTAGLVPPSGILEPALVGAATIEPEEPVGLLALALDLLVEADVITVGQAPDASGGLYRAYWSSTVGVDELVAAVRAEYASLPDEGDSDFLSADDPRSLAHHIRLALRDAGAISYVYLDPDGVEQVWVRR
ncbi:hypothetical protein [Microbacterium sp. B24]|uniref:hypothetical protein n=1 Tax=Microbacterium sp. B24 TaxID=95616 RepID=UPI0011D28321|nr:hypothetical protein [Microbacterium sp. B24]